MTPEKADSRKRYRMPDAMKMCAEAQADGVPCLELGRSCEVCERALRAAEDEDLPVKPDPPVTR